MNNKLNITKLEDTILENISGGKTFSEAVGDFIHDHPFLTFFIITNVVGSICTATAICAAKRGRNTQAR